MSTWTCGTIWFTFVTISLLFVTVFLSLVSSLFIIISFHFYSLLPSSSVIYSLLCLHTLPLRFPLLHHPQSPFLFALSPSPLHCPLHSSFLLRSPLHSPSPLHSTSHLPFPLSYTMRLPSSSLSPPLSTSLHSPLYSHNEGTVTKSQSHNQMSNLTGYGHGGDGSNDIESRDGWYEFLRTYLW
jgi:hypothetical protein